MQVPVLLRFFDRSFVTRMFFLLLLFSVPLLADGYLLIIAASYYGVFLTLGVSASIGLGGMIVILLAIDATLEHLRARIREGDYPTREYAELGSLVVAGVLVIVPGFFTDALAILLYLPFLRRIAGAAIVRPIRSRLKDAYEHLKLQEFETR